MGSGEAGATAGLTGAAPTLGACLRPLAWCPGDPLPPLSPRIRLPPGPLPGSLPRSRPPEPAAGPSPPPEVGRGESEPPTLLLLDRRDQRLMAGCDGLEGLLNPTERERWQRFRRPDDRQRHLLGRAAVRLALGAWLGRDPQELRFRQGPYGKPELDDAGPAAPRFNLAHSGAVIVLAFHRHWPVGVDVEQQQPQLDWRPLAARLLCAAECQQLERLPASAQPHGFLQAWCRLEARLKATGRGLGGMEALRRQAERAMEQSRELAVEQALELEPGARLKGAGGKPAGPGLRLGGLGLNTEERLWDLQLPDGYCGALACLVGAGQVERKAGAATDPGSAA